MWRKGVCFLLQKDWGSDSTADQVWLSLAPPPTQHIKTFCWPTEWQDEDVQGFKKKTNQNNKLLICQCGELTEELKERGDEVLTPFVSFLQQGSQFPPDQSWFIGRGWGGGTRLSSHTSNVGREQNHKSSRDTAGSVALSPHCRSPPQTLARTGSRRARLTLPAPVCLLFVCLFAFWGWGWGWGVTGRQTGASCCSPGRLAGSTNSLPILGRRILVTHDQ